MNTAGILDGEVNLTVQLTDAEYKLVATKTTAYTKDVVYPKSYYTRSNLQNDGTSSLDDFLIAVVVESQDVGGTYSAAVKNVDSSTSNVSNSFPFKPMNSSEPLLFTGDISSEEFNIADLDFSSLQDGYIEIKLDVIDPNGNPGQETHIAYYSIEGNNISYVGTTLAVDAIETLKRIILYPNPTSSKIYIGNQFGTVRLYDLFGRELIQSTSNQLDLSNLPNKVYMIKLEDYDGNVITTAKIIKN
jgi:hypothetical protein